MDTNTNSMKIKDIMIVFAERFAKANGYIEVETYSESRYRYIKPTWEDEQIMEDYVPKIEIEVTNISSRLSFEDTGSSFFIDYRDDCKLSAFFAFGEVAFKLAISIKNEIETMINN